MRTRRILLSVAGCLAGGAIAGCNGTDASGGSTWLAPSSHGGERWTIRCVRSNVPDHAQMCRDLAQGLRNTQGLDPGQVRVETQASSSTVYYGEYVKVPSASGTGLDFPPEFQRDISLIRRLGRDGYMPFVRAVPEQIETGASGTVPGSWQLASAAGRHTLQVAVFYNTPTFSERKQAAEDYTRILRDRGLTAYYLHEPARSYVFVGDFEDADIIQTERGPQVGPRVQALMNANNGEFRYMTENLHLVKHRQMDGSMAFPPAVLIPVPRPTAEETWR